MDFIEKNKKGFLIATGIGMVSVGLYMLIKSGTADVKIDSHAHNHNQSGLISQSRVFAKDKKYLEIIDKLRKAIENKKGGAYPKQILVGVNQAILELFKTDFLKIFQEIRNRRRQHLGNLAQYAEEYFNGSYETEKLLEDASVEVFKDLAIDPAIFEEQCDRASAEDPNFPMYMLYMLEQLKVQIPTKMDRPVTPTDVINGYMYQLTLLDQIDFSQFGDLTSESLILCKQSYISDLTSIKYKFEEEDIGRNPSILASNAKIMELHGMLQTKIYQGNI